MNRFVRVIFGEIPAKLFKKIVQSSYMHFWRNPILKIFLKEIMEESIEDRLREALVIIQENSLKKFRDEALKEFMK